MATGSVVRQLESLFEGGSAAGLRTEHVVVVDPDERRRAAADRDDDAVAAGRADHG